MYDSLPDAESPGRLMERSMIVERAERLGRVAAAAIGVVLLMVAFTTPTWWGLLGVVPLAIAFTGW
jgi:hypothetical protein